ncbi:hypothetical protein GBA52_022768 [Prunus armeniaca]|nr:hypothetical protein GBA52_022768 [Prunus armeniaca]
MAEKILEYRATLPDQLKNTFASILAAQKPLFLNGSDPGTSGAPNSGLLDNECRGSQIRLILFENF